MQETRRVNSRMHELMTDLVYWPSNVTFDCGPENLYYEYVVP